MLDGLGMLARTLPVAPESTAGTRLFRERAARVWARCWTDYAARLDGLLRRPPATKADDPSVLDPPVLRLHPEAAALWVAFHDEAEAALLPGGDYAAVKAFGAKLAEHAGRLAAVLTVYADADAMEVPGEMMACGIMLAQHYAAELLRLQGTCAVRPTYAGRPAPDMVAAQPDPRATWPPSISAARTPFATAPRLGGSSASSRSTGRSGACRMHGARRLTPPGRLGSWCRNARGVRRLGGAGSDPAAGCPANG